jgi:hypothetical protein
MTATTTPAKENRANGTIAIVVAVIAAAIAFALGFTQGWVLWLLILGELTAITLGIMAWHSGAGKIGVVLAVLLTVAVVAWHQSPRPAASDPAPAAAP